MYVCSSMYVCMYVTASQCAHICTYIYIAITRARANHNNYVCMYVCMYVTASQCARYIYMHIHLYCYHQSARKS